MQRIDWVPGIVVAGVSFDLPTGSPLIDRVLSATITRLRSGIAVPDHAAADVIAGVIDHPAADILAGIADHAVHSHDFVSQGLGGGVTNALGMPAGLNSIEDAGGVALHTAPGGAATGVQDIAAAQAHAGGAIVAHAAGVALVHAALTGATPVVAAVPTKVDGDTITLDVNTTLGDVLTLMYEEVGTRVAVA